LKSLKMANMANMLNMENIVASKLAKPGVVVSFAGVPKTIDNIPSEKWIDIYAGNWQDQGLEWQIVSVCALSV
jgi:hypothetical protein